MDANLQAALNGQLASTGSGKTINGSLVSNGLNIPIDIYYLDTNARRILQFTVAPNASLPLNSANEGDYYVAINSWTGAYIAVIVIPGADQQTATIDNTVTIAPDDVGTIPQPTAAMLIPPDSPRIFIGAGTVSQSNQTNYVVHEQYWKRTERGYSLAPSETYQHSWTATHGVSATSSDSTTIASSLSMSSSVNYAGFSASIAASLSKSTTTSHSVTVTDTTTTFHQQTVTNTTAKPQLFLDWSLTDVVSIFDPTGKCLAVIIANNGPSVIQGPYDITPPQKALPGDGSRLIAQGG